jgi:cell division protein FtsI (penicillin-binding protein 3)
MRLIMKNIINKFFSVSRFNIARLGIYSIYFALFFILIVSQFRKSFDAGLLNNNKKLNIKYDSITSNRLDIVDRNGRVLSHDAIEYSFYLVPSKMIDVEMNLDKVIKIFPKLESRRETLLKNLQSKMDSKNGLLLIEQKISYEQKQALLDNGILGLYFEETYNRHYIYSSMLYHVIGAINNEFYGYSGIERGMNSYLSNLENEKPLQLSIDLDVQMILYNALYQKMNIFKGKGAAGVVMNIENGEIVAAVSLPDCRTVNQCNANEMFNRFSFGVYELGSVAKLLLAANAFELGISPYKEYERSEYKIDNYVIHDIDKSEKAGGRINIIDIIKKSSNVGCARLVEEIGVDKQKSFLENLGLLERIYTQIPETTRPLYPKKWSLVNGVTISYGQSIAMSPLQFTTAVASLMNSYRVFPTFLKGNGEVFLGNRVISDEAKKVLTDVMKVVVTEGSGRKAYISEYDIGGKTGTGIKQVNGVYDPHKVTLTFVAVTPIDKPKYVFFIMLDEPFVDASNNSQIRGSGVMAPLMHEIISAAGPILKIPKKVVSGG